MATPFNFNRPAAAAAALATEPQLRRAIAPMLADRDWRSAPDAYSMRCAAIKTIIDLLESGTNPTAMNVELTGELAADFAAVMAQCALHAEPGMERVWKPLTKDGASALITWLGQLAWADRGVSKVEEANVVAAKAAVAASRSEELEDGMYVRPSDGAIFKVYVTRSGHKVAKRAIVTEVEGGYEAEMAYEGKAPLRTLDASMRMSVEEAQQFGALYGICCMCAAELNDETSVALGIGPVCGGREFGEPFKIMVKAARKALKAKGA
jgi:hypothetical protein